MAAYVWILALSLLALPAGARAGGEPPQIAGLDGAARALRYELFETRAEVTLHPTRRPRWPSP